MEFKAHYTSNGNIKLGKKMGVWSVLYGDQEIFVKDWDITVRGTCGHHCKNCMKECYVRKSYRYGSVIKGHAENTIAMRNDISKCLSDLDGQLNRKRKPFEFIRLDQSGEIENDEQLEMHLEIGRRHPETTFYLYSKAFEYIIPALFENRVPANFVILISIWHEYGIEIWNLLKHFPNVKAFVYDDGFDYSQYGIKPTTWCKAYNEKGKLDKRITCELCKKCMVCNNRNKVIYCKAH